MSRVELEKKAFECFNNGFCCSESLSMTIIDHYSENPENFPVNIASAFCGGIGRTHQDICGAFAGAVIAVGFLYGKTAQGEDLSKVKSIISEFRRQFLETFGSNNCATILEKFGEQKNNIKCKHLTAKATGMLSDILELDQMRSKQNYFRNALTDEEFKSRK